MFPLFNGPCQRKGCVNGRIYGSWRNRKVVLLSFDFVSLPKIQLSKRLTFASLMTAGLSQLNIGLIFSELPARSITRSSWSLVPKITELVFVEQSLVLLPEDSTNFLYCGMQHRLIFYWLLGSLLSPFRPWICAIYISLELTDKFNLNYFLGFEFKG